MTQWEYKVSKTITPYEEKSLHTFFGWYGWELCGICAEYDNKAQMTIYIYTFKRPYKGPYGKMKEELEKMKEERK